MNLWNFTIDDASPCLSYSPHSNGPDTSNGWRTWYTKSQFNSVPGQIAEGDSFHITSASNASVTLEFNGTGIALYGFSNCTSFDVSIDNGRPTTINTLFPSDSLIYSKYDLPNGPHSVTLRAQPSNASQALAFDSAIVSTPLRDNDVFPSPFFLDATTNTQSLVYSGTWSNGLQVGVPNTTVSAPFRKTTENGASMVFTFTDATAIVVKGLTNSDTGLYSVSLDGSSKTLNATSPYVNPDTLLFFSAGLDPTSPHHLTMTNLGSGLNINSLTTFQRDFGTNVPTTAPSKKPVNLGVILGPVLGFVFLLFLGMFIWYRYNLVQADGTRKRIPTQILTFTKPKNGPHKVVPIRSQRTFSFSSIKRPSAPIVTKRSTPRGRRVYDLDSEVHSESSSTRQLTGAPAYYREGEHFDSSEGVSVSGPGSVTTNSEETDPYQHPPPSSESYGYALDHITGPNSAPQTTNQRSPDNYGVPVSGTTEYTYTPSRVTSRPLPVPPYYSNSHRPPESTDEGMSVSDIHFSSDVSSERDRPPPGYVS